MRLVGRLVRAVVALAVLAVVVAGVPALLATVGWPLPDHVPTLEELQRGLAPGALSTDAVLKGLVVVGWMLWALVMVGALVEAVAVLRHRQAPSLPGVGPFQGFARWLVTSLSLSLGGLSAAGPALANPMPAPPPAVVLSVASGAPVAEMAPAEPARAAVVAAPTYVVQRNDSLVGIAQAVLGDADRWPEIFDLNQGVPQAGGGALRSAGVIRTGWVLQLPADARMATAAEAPARALAEEDREVRAGESMWSIAEERLATATGAPGADVSDEDVGPYWAEVVATNAPVVRSGDPSLIYPGERLRLPGVAANGNSSASVLSPSAPTTGPSGAAPSPASETPTALTTAPSDAPPASVVAPPAAAPDTADSATTAVTVPSVPAATATPITPPAPVVRPGVVAAPPPMTNGTVPSPPPTAGGAVLRPNVAPAPPAVVDDAEETPSTTAVLARPATNSGWDLPHVTLSGPGLVGAGLLAAGVVGALDRLVRARSRRGRARGFDPTLAGNELALRVGADPEGAAFVDLGLRAMAGSLREAGREVPDVLGVELGSRQLEVILAEASTPAPRPFSTKDRGRRWVLVRRSNRAELEELAEDMPAPCPTLVTVGTTADGTRLLIDLEQAGASALVGPRAISRQVLAAATTELATSGWADYIRLVLVGFAMAGQERVQVVGSVAEVIDDLEREATELGTLLAEAGCSSTLEARVRGEAADAWIPTVVVCAKAPPARQARRLAAVATTAGNAGVAVVVAGELEGAWRLELDEDAQLSVEVLGATVVSAQQLSSEEAGALDALFEHFRAPVDDGDPEEEWAEGEGDDLGSGIAGTGAEEDEAPFFPDYLSEGADEDSTWAVGPAPAAAGSPRANGHGKVTADDAEDDEEPVVEDQARVIVPTAAPVGPPPGLPPELSRLRLLADHDLLVGVMGPIEVWGAKPFTRAKALELVVYLTLHPGAAVDAERLMDVLWPQWRLKKRTDPGGRDSAGAQRSSRQPTHRTLHTTTSVARDCLGTSPAGQRRLPHLHGNGTRDFYRLLDVALDFQLFRDAQVRASAVLHDDRIEAKRELTEALTLVRGVPFQDVRDEPRNYKWAHVSGAIDLIERHVREAALLLAELHLDDGDPGGARWAARQGLLANPGHRLLKCAEFKAEGLARNPAGVEGAMRELGELIEADEPADSLDAHTVAVYKEQMAVALGR